MVFVGSAVLGAWLGACGGAASNPTPAPAPVRDPETGNGSIAPGAPPSPAADAHLCEFDASPGSAVPVLVVATGRKVTVVRSDGSNQVLREFQGNPGLGIRSLISNANYTLVALDGQWPAGDHQVVFGHDGNVVWERDETPRTQISFAALDDHGAVVELQEQMGAADEVLFYGLAEVQAGATLRTLSGTMPLGGTVGKSIPIMNIRSRGDDPTNLGWLDADGTIHPVSLPPGAPYAFDGERFAFVDSNQTDLVIESESERHTIALPETVATSAAVAIRGDWALVGDLRVDLTSGQVEKIAEPPDGLRRYSGAQRVLDDDGAILDAFRNDYLGAMYRSPDAGKTWVAVADSVRQGSQLRAAPTSGTYLIRNESTFVGEQSWPPLPSGIAAALEGTGVVVSRPASRQERVFASNQAGQILSSDGLCLAYWESDSSGYTLKVWDLKTDRTHKLLQGEGRAQAQWMETSSQLAPR
jgi:hypothetical protein